MSICYAASIQLLNSFADRDTNSYHRRLIAARACAALGMGACRPNPNLIHVIIFLPWCASYEVLAWKTIRLNALDEQGAAAAVRAELGAVMDLLRLYVKRFDTFKHKWPIQNLRRFGIHTAELTQWNIGG